MRCRGRLCDCVCARMQRFCSADLLHLGVLRSMRWPGDCEVTNTACSVFRLETGGTAVQRVTALAIATAACAAVVHHSTYVHPYLLADNRHFTFYLWKDVLGPLGAWRAALAPVFCACGWLLCASLAVTQSALWIAGLAACTSLALIPAGLLELRYFTVPAFMVALHLPVPSRARIALQCCLFAAVNAVTIWLFAERPFRWPDGSVARFMW